MNTEGHNACRPAAGVRGAQQLLAAIAHLCGLHRGKGRAETADRESVRVQVPAIDLLTRLQAPRGTEQPVYRNKQL